MTTMSIGMSSAMNIGVCGMGKMGAAIAQRLISVGHTVTVWNRDAAKTAPLMALGAKTGATPADLVRDNDIVITMLLNDKALDDVYNGGHGLLSGAVAGKLLIDMSTVLPKTQERIGRDVVANGAGYVECPVGGTVGPARDGKLLGLVGGREADVARAKPVLEQLCRRIEHVGVVGSGARMKLAVNLPLMVYWQALGEALALCQPLGLAPERLVDILSDTSGTPAAMKLRGPDIAKLLVGQTIGTPAFDVGAARKDLDIMVSVGMASGVAMPVTAATLGCFIGAEEKGLTNADAINVPVLWAKRGAQS
jgi:3-hydroxyisobutyrate dehydrogenase